MVDLIVYVDTSILARAYLPDEPGHDEAVTLLRAPDFALVTGAWTRIEVTGALVRAGRQGRRTARQLHAALEALSLDLGTEGPVSVLRGPTQPVEARTLELVIEHGTRAIDTWHLAMADIVARGLTQRGQPLAFATRDQEQSAVAKRLGFELV